MKILCNLLCALMDKSASFEGNNAVILNKVSGEIQRVAVALNRGYSDFSLVGKSNVGKSTVIDALLGEASAPRKNGPYTSAVVEYRYAEKYSLIMKEQNEELISLQNYDSNAELLEDLKKTATVTDESVFSSAERTIVRMPSVFLKNKIVIFDTPGYGATVGNDSEPGREPSSGVHDAIVDGFLNADECLNTFWVIRENITDEIKELMNKYCRKNRTSSRHCMIVNTRSLDDEFVEGFKKEYHNELAMLNNRVFFVNAKKATTDRGEDAENLRNWVLKQITVSQENIGHILTDLLRRMSVQCSELEKRSIRWSQVSLSNAVARCKEKNLTEAAELILNMEKNPNEY